MEYAFRNAMTRFLLVLSLLGLMTGMVWAQGGTGELQGLVTDPSGAVVANAQVTLTNTATGDKRATVTTPAGIYRFSGLAVVGTYTLEMAPKGFKSAKVANINVSVGTVVNQDVHLELGAASEQVTVEAGVQAVQTTDSAISDLLDRRVWQQMPLETRDQNQFINLLAGAAQGNIALNSANGGTDRGAAVNGTRSGTGNYLVEGFDNNDQGLGGGGSIAASTGGGNTTISPDAIQEFRVIEHNFSAEYGRAGGFIADAVLKGGTNQWHGSLFEYNRIQALAANSFFSNRNNVNDSLVRNQFGGSVGGPIVKDKTFFYFTTEFRRDRSNSPLSGNVPTEDFLNFYNTGGLQAFEEGTGIYAGAGGFCETFLGAPCPGSFSNESTFGPIFANLNATQPTARCVTGASNCIITNPTPAVGATPCSVGSFGGALGGGLYSSSVTGVDLATCPGIFPVPIFGNVTVPQAQTLDQARYTVKIDHKLGNNDSLSGTFLYDNGDTNTQWAGADTTFGPDLPNHARAMNGGISWSHTFSPTILNQARMSYTRHTANFPGAAAQEASAIPSIISFFDPSAQGYGNAANLPQFFTENRFEYKDDLSITRGKHNFKTGASYSRTRNGSSFESSFFGNFYSYGILDILSDFKFGADSDAAYIGIPYYGSWYYAQATINPTITPAVRPVYYRGFRSNEYSAYFQDDWRIHPRLTLNLGVRWEYFGPPHNFQQNLDSNYFPGAPITPIVTTSANPFFPANNPVLASFATGALQIRNHEIWNKDTNNFAPRIGFSWDVTGKQKAVVRGGFGIAYDRLYNNVFENLRFNPPFFCFCATGLFRSGALGGDAINTPGLYDVPFTTANVANFNSPTVFPRGLPLTSPRALDPNLLTAYYEQGNFGFQYEVAKDLVWETDYVGTWGRKLVGIVNLNTFPGRTVPGLGTTRLNPTVSNINLRTNAFNSNYNALQTSLRKRFSNGLQFDANYTWSKALDQISDTFTPRAVNAAINPTDSIIPSLDYGPADFNIKHRFVISYSYDLPFYKTNRWIGGWSVNGIVTAQSGVPFSIFNGTVDTNQNGTFNDRGAFIGSGSYSSAYTSGNPADGYVHTEDFAAIVSTARFVPGTPQQFPCPATVNLGGSWCEGAGVGQLPRGAFVGPKYVDVDFGVAKRFKITESAGLTLQASFFNLFNHPNFAIPDQNLNDLGTTFGASQATFAPGQGGARVTQLAIRFEF